MDVNDEKVQAAAAFSIQELRKYCDYCNDELRDTYQNLKIQKLDSAETRPTTLSDGTMYFLSMTMESTVPYAGETTDNQTVIVFENVDGSYNGISVERSPFLAH